MTTRERERENQIDWAQLAMTLLILPVAQHHSSSFFVVVVDRKELTTDTRNVTIKWLKFMYIFWGYFRFYSMQSRLSFTVNTQNQIAIRFVEMCWVIWRFPRARTQTKQIQQKLRWRCANSFTRAAKKRTRPNTFELRCYAVVRTK